MAFHLLATFKSKPGREAELAEALIAMVAPTRAEHGCLAYSALLDPEEQGTVVMVQEWASLEALQQHISTAHFANIASRFSDLLQESPDIIELDRATDSQFAKLGLTI